MKHDLISSALIALLAGLLASPAAAQGTDGTRSGTRGYECRERRADIAEPPKREPAGPKDYRGKQTTIEAGKAVEASSLCPEGQLPVPREYFAPKGAPFFSETAVDAPYQYAGAWASAGGRIPLFDGGGVVTRVEDPAVSRPGGTHSLFEISVQGGEGNGNIVEIGWTKEPGDNAPRLFVFHWVNWIPACYNGCGWVQWHPSIVPGMVLNPGTESYMGYVFFEGNWWAWYANQWVGYFPGTQWRGAYTRASLVQWFGEVYESDPTPETDMGNGQYAVAAPAARFWYPCTVEAAAWVCWIHPTPSLNQPSLPWYTIQNAGGSAHRYGGPGGRVGVGLDP